MSLTKASDTGNMQVKITSDKPDKQCKNGDEQMGGMSVSEDAAISEFGDPAILFVRAVNKIHYTKEELLKLRDTPLSKKKPDFDPSVVPTAILDPERWNLERKKSETSEGGGPPAEPRRRAGAGPGAGDPRERVRKENDGIVLSPQRRSFNTGCFVPASSATGAGGGGSGRAEGGAGGRGNRSHSPLGGGKNDGPHLGIREIQSSGTNHRRIGSGRILRDSWDFGAEKPESGGGGDDGGPAEYGFRGAPPHRRDGDKYEQRRSFDRDFGRDKEGGGGRRNNRYDRRRISDREQEEPEWFSCGPTSQNDTIELRGFEDGKKRMSPSRARRAKEWSKKKNEVPQKQSATEDKEEAKDVKGRRTSPSPPLAAKAAEVVPKQPDDVSEKKEEKKPENVCEKIEEEVKSDDSFNLDHFLKFDNIPALLTNGVGSREENTTSRFSRWFNKQESPEKPVSSSRRSSLHDDQPSIIKDLLKDIGETTVAMPGDSEAYFAPISPAANTGSVIGHKRSNHHHPPQPHPVNIMEMLQKGRGQNDGNKQQVQPPAGKILSLDELESKMLQNVDGPAQKHQPQKPDEEMAAAFKKLLAQAQAGVHPVSSNGPMNKQPMSLLEMLSHSQQQDEAARMTSNRLCAHQQPVNELAMKLQQAQQMQQQKHQMEMLNKLINATTSSMHPQQQQHMRGSPLHDLGMQQSRELLNRPEAQAILQGLKRGEITTQHLYQQLANPALQPRHREMLSTVIKMHGGGGYGPRSPRALSPQPPMFQQQSAQQQLSVSPLPAVNAMHQRIPSPRELQVHTQNILQRALIKKKLEEQQENYRKKQEMQRGQSPGITGIGQQGALGHAKNVGSPTPLAFTPTSVLRKMTADKDEGKENKGMIDGKVPLGRALTGVRPQPVQPQGQQWNPQFPAMKHQGSTGRPIVKANNHYQTQTPEQFFSQHQAQQQRMYNQPPPGITSSQQLQQQQQQRSKQQHFAPAMSAPGGSYNPPSYSTNQQFNPQQLRAQHQHRPGNQTAVAAPAQPLQQSARGQQMGYQQGHVGGAAWQQHFFGNAGARTSSTAVPPTSAAPATPSSDRLLPTTPSSSSPTADQLSRWFSPDLLERARVGELPSTAGLMAAVGLEEIERQAAPAPVRN